jgi:hypothetical protein
MTKRRTNEKRDISEVIFHPIKPTSKGLICYVSFTYDNSIRVNEVSIYTRPAGGYRLLYPIKLLANGKTVSCVYPINKEIGTALETFLLAEYSAFLKKTIANKKDIK